MLPRNILDITIHFSFGECRILRSIEGVKNSYLSLCIITIFLNINYFTRGTDCIELESILVSSPAARRIADIQLARIPEVTADRM